MDRVRHRVAIGSFASVAAVEPVVARLRALGIGPGECFVQPAGPGGAELALQRSTHEAIAVARLHLVAGEQIVLRIALKTLADEQAVAQLLLNSPALSVQLHDVNSPPHAMQ